MRKRLNYFRKAKSLRRLAQPTWYYILEAARGFNGKPFTPKDIVDRIYQKAPRAKVSTIYPYLYGMTPNYPSNKKYPAIRKNHVAFTYLGKRCFQMLRKDELFKQLMIRAERILKEARAKEANLKAACRLLYNNVSYYNWVGFYIVDERKPEELVLSSFMGEPTEHMRIPFGRGICGQAASVKKTLVVQDVSKESNYLSCGPKVKSEVVVPIFKKNQVIGELDIDSHFASPFTWDDEVLLSRIAELAGRLL
jgi:putative methionine-R-sulfoxide reductase with GAF domain